MKAKADSSIGIKKFVYYLDEFLILGVILISVISADAVQKAIKSLPVTGADFVTNIPNLIVSCMVAIVIYGSMYIRPYSEKEKAPVIKRVTNAMQAGFAWRLMLN